MITLYVYSFLVPFEGGNMDAQRLIELLEDAECEPRSYSGRGMYGRRCVAVVPDSYSSEGHVAALTMLYAADETEQQELVTIWRDVQSDGMGRGIVIYFPNIEWPADAVVSRRQEDDDDGE
jgi:hypothetical protein